MARITRNHLEALTLSLEAQLKNLGRLKEGERVLYAPGSPTYGNSYYVYITGGERGSSRSPLRGLQHRTGSDLYVALTAYTEALSDHVA